MKTSVFQHHLYCDLVKHDAVVVTLSGSRECSSRPQWCLPLVGSPGPGVVADALLDHLLPCLLRVHLHFVARPLRFSLALQLVGQLLQVFKLQLYLGGVPS